MSDIKLKHYSQEMLNKLKEKVKIEDFLLKDVQVKKIKNNFSIECPFCHGEKSMSVSIKKQFAYCFVCKKSFDVFGYLHQVKKMEFPKAVLEVKKIINTNNQKEFKKLNRALECIKDIINGIDPITKAQLKSQIFFEKDIIFCLKKIEDIFSFLMADYYKLDQERFVSKRELDEYKQTVQKICNKCIREECEKSREKLNNLFVYIMEKLLLIEQNWYNLSGIAHGV